MVSDGTDILPCCHSSLAPAQRHRWGLVLGCNQWRLHLTLIAAEAGLALQPCNTWPMITLEGVESIGGNDMDKTTQIVDGVRYEWCKRCHQWKLSGHRFVTCDEKRG